MIVMKGINEFEVDEMLKFVNSFNKGEVRAILQIIELLKTPNLEKYYYDISKIEKKYSERAYHVKVRAMHKRKQYWLKEGVIEFVKPLDNTEFCMNCNRIRITSDGKLKLCLLRDDVVDLNNLHGEKLIKAIKQAVLLRKPYFLGENVNKNTSRDS